MNATNVGSILQPDEPERVGTAEKSQLARPVIDEAVLDELLASLGQQASQAFAELVHTFQMHTPALVENLQQHVAAQNWPALRNDAHALKGNCALFGASQVVHLCEELESALDRGAVQGASEQVANITHSYQLVTKVLQRKVENSPGQQTRL